MRTHHLLAAGLAALAIDAAAVTTAHLRTTDWNVAVEDLDTVDGIGPTVSWLGDFDLMSQAMEGHQNGWAPFFGLIVPTYDYTLVQQVTSAPEAVSSVTSPLGRVHSTATTTFFDIDMSAQAGESLSASVQRMESFAVSAHTQVTLSMRLDTFFTAGGVPWPPSFDPPYYYQSAGASISSTVYVFTSDGSFWQHASFDASLMLPVGADYAEAGDPNGVLSITFANDTDASRTFRLQHMAFAGAFQSGALPAAVPEPSTWGLLGGGLIAVAAVRRRRSNG